VRAVGVERQRRPGNRIQRGGNHQLQIALGQDDVGVLPVQNLALLRNAELAVEAVDRLREDRAMRGTAAATYRAAASVEEAKIDAGLAGHGVQ